MEAIGTIGASLGKGLAYTTSALLTAKVMEKASDWLFPEPKGNMSIPNRPAQTETEMPYSNIASNYLPAISPESGMNRIIINRIRPMEMTAPAGAYPKFINSGGMPQNIISAQPGMSMYSDRVANIMSGSGVVHKGSYDYGGKFMEKQDNINRLRTQSEVVREKKKDESSIFVTKKKK